MNANNTYNSDDAKHNHLWCFEHAWRPESKRIKRNKFKIAGGLFNSVKNN